MQRTQVYFPKEYLDYLKKEAEEKDTSLADIIRKKVEKAEPKIKKTKKKKANKTHKNAGDLLLEMAREAKEIGASGPKDLATNPDKYLYGTE